MSGTGGNEYSTEQQVMGVLDVNVNESTDIQATTEQAKIIKDSESFKSAIKDKETTADQLNEQINKAFLEELKKSLTPDDAKELKADIERIQGYDNPNTPLNDVYKYIVNVFVCNTFNTEGSKEHNNISEEMRFDVNKYLNQNIKNGINRFINMLDEMNSTVKDDKIADLIIATKSILNGNDISGKSLLKIADYLGISLKDDEKYDKQGRLNRLGKEVFGIDSHSLLKKLEEEVVNTEARYKERFIPATFNDDIMIENSFLEYSPRIPEDFSGKIESRQNENMIELGVFDNNGKLLEGTRKDLSKNEIKSGQFDENGNLKEGYFIKGNGNIIIGMFNYEGKDGYFDDSKERHAEGVDEGLPGQNICYDTGANYFQFTDTDRDMHSLTTYEYNDRDNTITFKNTSTKYNITVHKNGEHREELIFDFIVEKDPMNLIENKPMNNSSTIFQQFCENNSIDYNNTKGNIDKGIKNINENNLYILRNQLNIIDLLDVKKIDDFGIFSYNGLGELEEYRIQDNSIQQHLRKDGQQKRENRENEFVEDIAKKRQNNLEIKDGIGFADLVKFENTRALKDFIIENNLIQIYINQIKDFLGTSNNESPDPSNTENQNNSIENQEELSEIDPNQITNLRSKRKINENMVAEFFNDKITEKDTLDQDQKKLLLLTKKGLTTGSRINDDVRDLQKMLNVKDDGQFGKDTFNALKNKFPNQ